MAIKQKIFYDLEPHFIYDYIFFSAHLRFLQAQENSYIKYNSQQVARNMCLVNLFETYQKSLEDLAAISLAFYRRYNKTGTCQFQKAFGTEETPLIYTLINYKPGDAYMDQILKLVSTDSQIITFLGIVNLEKIDLTLLYKDLNFRKIYNFFTVGLKSLAGDQKNRLKMFNKIKHGGIVVPDGHLYSPTLTSHSPAVIYADPMAFDPDDHPLVIHGFKLNDDEFELMRLGIIKVAVMIKVWLSAYLCKEYHGFKMNDGFIVSLELFKKIDAKKHLSLWNGY